MHIDLTSKRAVVTGSTLGIGFAIAVGLARAGAAVVVNGRSDAGVSAAVDRLKQLVDGADVEGVAEDLSTAAGAEAFTRRVPTAEILVNNLGIFDPKPFLDIPDGDWERFYQVNVMSGVRLSRHYLPHMLEQDWGRVLFISSESAVQIPPEMIHYGMTKTAQLAISRGLAETCAGTGITVNAVLPGLTLSEGVAEFVQKMGGDESKSIEQRAAEFVREHRPTSILQRAATAEEVANMCVYLCSRQAAATTGAAVSVDGGTRRSVI